MRICRFKVRYARLNDYYYVVERVKIKSKMGSFISFLEYYANWYGYVWLSVRRRLQRLRWYRYASTTPETNLWKDRSFTRRDTTVRSWDHKWKYWLRASCVDFDLRLQVPCDNGRGLIWYKEPDQKKTLYQWLN